MDVLPSNADNERGLDWSNEAGRWQPLSPSLLEHGVGCFVTLVALLTLAFSVAGGIAVAFVETVPGRLLQDELLVALSSVVAAVVISTGLMWSRWQAG